VTALVVAGVALSLAISVLAVIALAVES